VSPDCLCPWHSACWGSDIRYIQTAVRIGDHLFELPHL